MNGNFINSRLFISTVPKAGKNVLYTFLNKMGILRFDSKGLELRDLAMQSTYAGHFCDLNKRATWALPALGDSDLEKLSSAKDQFLMMICDMPEAYFIGHHFAFNEALYEGIREQQIPIVFLYRDPRDILLSMGNYFLAQGKPEHLSPKFSGLSLEDAMLLLLDGDEEIVPFSDYLESFSGWLKADGVFSIRFEDIVGPLGGGTEKKQFESFRLLVEHLSCAIPDDKLEAAIYGSFSTLAGTFYKGQIGGWKSSFTKKVAKKFKEKAEHVVSSWGYDKPVKLSGQNIDTLRSYVITLLKEREQFYSKKLGQVSEQYSQIKAELGRIEEDSRKRLELIHKLTNENQDLKSFNIKIDDESKSRLELLKKKDKEILNLKDFIASVEQENKIRLELIRKHEAKIGELSVLHSETEQERKGLLELVKKRDEAIVALKSSLTKAEGENRLLLQQVNSHDETIAEMSTARARAEHESRSFLEQMKTLNEGLSEFKALYLRTEEENKARHELIVKHEAKIDELNALSNRIEEERKVLVELLKKRDEEITTLNKFNHQTERERKDLLEVLNKRDMEITSIRELASCLGQENEARLELVRRNEENMSELNAMLKKRDADALELNKEIEYWKREATTFKGLGRQIIRKIRKTKTESF